MINYYEVQNGFWLSHSRNAVQVHVLRYVESKRTNEVMKEKQVYCRQSYKP